MPTNYPSLASLMQQAEDLVVSREPLPRNPAALANRCTWLRRHLTEALGYMPPHEAPLLAHTESQTPLADGLFEETVTFAIETGAALRVRVIRPSETGGALPGVMLLHGWDLCKSGLTAAATTLACAGHVVLIPYNQCVVKRAKDQMLDGFCGAPGMTYMGLTTYENMRTLDYLCSREDVNAQRVACMGVCWSGIQCYVLTALDERVKVACTVCGMAPQGTLPTDFAFAQGHMCIGTFLPGFLTAAGVQDLMALIAPRPLLVQNNVTDECYPVLCFRRSRAETKMVYRTLGHPERFDAYVDTSVRDLTPEFVDRAVEWLHAYLA